MGLGSVRNLDRRSVEHHVIPHQKLRIERHSVVPDSPTVKGGREGGK